MNGGTHTHAPVAGSQVPALAQVVPWVQLQVGPTMLGSLHTHAPVQASHAPSQQTPRVAGWQGMLHVGPHMGGLLGHWH
jgi:hypothetical protein